MRNKAKDFSARGIAKTHLFFVDGLDYSFAGICSLSSKVFSIPKESLSKTQCKKFERYGALNPETHNYDIPSILLAQFGKNYRNAINENISGEEMLNEVFRTVRQVQRTIGGGLLFAECKNNKKLISFYENNGFRQFQSDESIASDGLIKLIKFL